MGKPASREPELPEANVDRLARRLGRHQLSNRLLAVFPPLLLLIYAVTALFLLGRVGFGVLLFSVAAVVGVGVAALLHFQTTVPSREQVGRLLDQRVDGKECFLTLATMNAFQAEPWVVAKLRTQTSQLLRRVNFRRDFPYRLRRESVLSLLLSVVAIVLLHLVLETRVLSLPDPQTLEKVQGVAKRISRQSGLEQLALGAQKAARDFRAKIQGNPMVKKIIEQLEARLGSGSQDGRQDQTQGLSGKKSKQGKGNRERKNAAGTEQAPGDGQEEGQSGETPGDEQDNMAQSSTGDQSERKPSQKGTRKGEKETGVGGAKERDQSQRSDAKNGGSKDQEKSERDRAGSRKPDEGIPEGKPPERFNRPGEGTEGIEGGRFVTVALPKAIATGSGSNGVTEREGGSVRTPVPFSNVPLPPGRDPEAASEKQHMPLEYRKLFDEKGD